MLKELLKVDERDKTIIELLQKDPNMPQEDIARILKLSQPSVSTRIRNLKEKGALSHVIGVNFKKINLHLAKVDISTIDTHGIINEFKDCPFFLNGFITSGRHNLCLFFTSTNLDQLAGVINHHLKDNSKVKEVELNVVIQPIKDFVMPFQTNKKECGLNCKECIKY